MAHMELCAVSLCCLFMSEKLTQGYRLNAPWGISRLSHPERPNPGDRALRSNFPYHHTAPGKNPVNVFIVGTYGLLCQQNRIYTDWPLIRYWRVLPLTTDPLYLRPVLKLGVDINHVRIVCLFVERFLSIKYRVNLEIELHLSHSIR